MPTAAPPDQPSAGPRIRRGQIVATPNGQRGFVHKVDGRVAFLRDITTNGRLTVGGIAGQWLADRLSVVEDVPEADIDTDHAATLRALSARVDALAASVDTLAGNGRSFDPMAAPGDPEIERRISARVADALSVVASIGRDGCPHVVQRTQGGAEDILTELGAGPGEMLGWKDANIRLSNGEMLDQDVNRATRVRMKGKQDLHDCLKSLKTPGNICDRVVTWFAHGLSFLKIGKPRTHARESQVSRSATHPLDADDIA